MIKSANIVLIELSHIANNVMSITIIEADGAASTSSLYCSTLSSRRKGNRKRYRFFLELDALLGADAGGEWVFYFAHLSNEVRGFDQFRWSVAAGNDDV